MKTDWQARLLETRLAAAKAPAATLQSALHKVVQQVVADGSASLAEVSGFLAQHKDVFGDSGEQAAKKAAGNLLDSSAPKRVVGSTSTASTASTGVKAHALRVNGGGSWHAQVQLPTPPAVLVGRGEPVVVDGERFTQADIAELVKLAA